MKFSKSLMVVALLVGTQAVVLFGAAPRATAAKRPAETVKPVVKPASPAKDVEMSVSLSEQLKVQKLNVLFGSINSYFKLPRSKRTSDVIAKIKMDYKFVGNILDEQFAFDASASERAIVPYGDSQSQDVVSYGGLQSQDVVSYGGLQLQEGNNDDGLARLEQNIRALPQYLLSENDKPKNREDFKDSFFGWELNIINLVERLSLTNTQRLELIDVVNGVVHDFDESYKDSLSPTLRQLMDQRKNKIIDAINK